MTTQEAIKVLQTLYNAQRLDTLTQEEMSAVAMAIRSLEADRTIEKVLYAIREEMQYIKVAELQIYGKASWRFTNAIEDIINKHLQEVENADSN